MKSERYPPTLPEQHALIGVYFDLCELQVISHAPDRRQGRGVATRGTVTKFTRRSRSRMLRKLAKARNLHEGVFCTLTYPDGFPQAAVTWKRHLDTLIKRIRRCPWETVGMWRMELKPRQSGHFEGYLAPHFHLLIFAKKPGFRPKIEVFRRWLRLAWYVIAHNGDKNEGLAGTQADIIHNRRHAQSYASKYAAKADSTFTVIGEVGRHWGTWGDWDLTCSILLWLTREQYIKIRRLFRAFIAARSPNRRLCYARAIARSPPCVGVAVFGLGDTSNLQLCPTAVPTIFNMLYACISN